MQTVPKDKSAFCNQPYLEITDFDQDLADLVAICQRHTHCSAAYCIRTHGGLQSCCFGYPKPLQTETTILTKKDVELTVITACNDCSLNSYNPVQLSAWRANVDMQYCVSRHQVIEYISKCAHQV